MKLTHMKNNTSTVFPRMALRPLVLALGLLAAAPLVQADAATDGALMADHQGYKAQQDAIQALNDTGRHRLASYPLAKAQCWLDVSFHEYTRNDRSAFPQGAFDASRAITDFLARGGAPGAAENPAQQTPLVNDALRLREDLWAQAGTLKTHAGWRCAERLVACGEVELVHAGNEHRQQGWRHAKPYVQIAEDLIGDARLAAEACPPLPVPVPPVVSKPVDPPPAPPVVPVPPPAVVVQERIVLSANVLFAFDRRGLADLLPEGRGQLDQLVARLNSVYARVDRLELVGHTDRLGTEAYNARLSTDRAETVKAYLQQQGVKVDIVAQGRGAAEPLPHVTCTQRSLALLAKCLQPNRRVEISITGVPR
ncbi:OmpA family protein [Sphaerotilus sp.]|uniref:OmpA family protein n=1 Tax=Sphaerotilus sp. TaxID=2093942 RepID=UPI002ACE27BF|nr:OmpA family protein [Sphaerotilus sp.]MDZ7858166.1 OmpA family protein [Sphaerotilus sp.]